MTSVLVVLVLLGLLGLVILIPLLVAGTLWTHPVLLVALLALGVGRWLWQGVARSSSR